MKIFVIIVWNLVDNFGAIDIAQGSLHVLGQLYGMLTNDEWLYSCFWLW